MSRSLCASNISSLWLYLLDQGPTSKHLSLYLEKMFVTFCKQVQQSGALEIFKNK